MSRRLRRLPVVLVPLLVLASLSACGDDTGSGDDGASRLDAVSISGDVGSAPDVAWKSRMTAGAIESETLVEGDGPALEDGDQVLTHIWIGNGFTQDEAFSTYAEKQPELLSVDDQLPEFLTEVKGATIGSRFAVTGAADKAFGETGNPSLGIANKDAVLFVVDLVSAVADGPSGDDVPAPSWMPALEPADGEPTGFDFAKAAQPKDKLRAAVLVKGDGAVVEKGQTIVVNYLGQVFGGKKPFDENYSKDQATSFGIGTGQVIKAWDQALVGATVGSRVVLEVPPRLGYGKGGNEQAGIKGTDTLVFVIDVLAAG